MSLMSPEELEDRPLTLRRRLLRVISPSLEL